jgi:hypothetical protein
MCLPKGVGWVQCNTQKKKKTKQNKTKKTTSLATSNMQKPELNAYRDG